MHKFCHLGPFLCVPTLIVHLPRCTDTIIDSNRQFIRFSMFSAPRVKFMQAVYNKFTVSRILYYDSYIIHEKGYVTHFMAFEMPVAVSIFLLLFLCASRNIQNYILNFMVKSQTLCYVFTNILVNMLHIFIIFRWSHDKHQLLIVTQQEGALLQNVGGV